MLRSGVVKQSLQIVYSQHRPITQCIMWSTCSTKSKYQISKNYGVARLHIVDTTQHPRILLCSFSFASNNKQHGHQEETGLPVRCHKNKCKSTRNDETIIRQQTKATSRLKSHLEKTLWAETCMRCMGAWSVFLPCHLHTKRIHGRSNQVSDCLRCLPPRFAMLVQSAMKHQVRSRCWVPAFALIILPALHGTLSWPWSCYYGRLHQLPISPDSPWLESLPVSGKKWVVLCVLAWDYQRLKLQWLMPWTTMCCKERTEELRRHESVTRLCASRMAWSSSRTCSKDREPALLLDPYTQASLRLRIPRREREGTSGWHSSSPNLIFVSASSEERL